MQLIRFFFFGKILRLIHAVLPTVLCTCQWSNYMYLSNRAGKKTYSTKTELFKHRFLVNRKKALINLLASDSLPTILKRHSADTKNFIYLRNTRVISQTIKKVKKRVKMINIT